MNFLREIVSGPKKRYTDSGYNLDLTYVCRRIIAMSFPASGFESAYRNSIEDVSQLLKSRHPKRYQVYNLSGRKYDYSKFDNQVLEFQWEDHHSPPINLLFEICQKIDQFLKENNKNVIVVHCLAGKGRTGTIICCYLMYCGRIKNPKEALDFYAKKRFETSGLGVTQPSQIRYIHYFHMLLEDYKLSPTVQLIEYVKLIGVPSFSSKNSSKPFLEIYSMRDLEKKYSNKNADHIVFKTNNKKKSISTQNSSAPPSLIMKVEGIIPIYGDILIKVINHGIYRNKTMFRFAFNTAFLPENKILSLNLKDLDPDSVAKNKKFPSDFCVEVKFKELCKCTSKTAFSEKCSQCLADLQEEESNWSQIYKIMSNYKINSIIDASKLLFGDPGCDDIEETLSNKALEPLMANNKSSDSDSEEDELEKMFVSVLTKKATKKQASYELMDTLTKNFEEENKKNNNEDEPNDKKLRLMKTKSFVIKPTDSALKLAKNESKTKEN